MTTEVFKHTYEVTCEVCDKIAHYMSSLINKAGAHLEIVGTARAASQLAAQGYHEEARALILQLKELKSK